MHCRGEIEGQVEKKKNHVVEKIEESRDKKQKRPRHGLDRLQDRQGGTPRSPPKAGNP